MKNTRKILSGILCFAMLFSTNICAHAAENVSEETDSNVKITWGAEESFTVNIPATFDFSNNTATAVVTAENVMIEEFSTLDISISGADYTDKWELLNELDPTDKLTYAVGTSVNANDISNNDVVLSVESNAAANAAINTTLYFTITDKLTRAGTYSDYLTFTIKVNKPEIPGLYDIDGNLIISYDEAGLDVAFDILGDGPETAPPSYDFSVYNIAERYSSTVHRLVIPEGITKIGQYGLHNYYTKEVVLPKTLKEVGPYSFNCVPVTEIVLPSGFTTINNYAFAANNYLKDIYLPTTVTYIGTGILSSTGSWNPDGEEVLPVTIHYEGTEEQWNAIDKAANWNYSEYDNIEIVFNSTK